MSMVFDGSVELGAFSVQQAVGKTVRCVDGKDRRVVEIVPSHAKPWLSIINENDPDSKSGYFVHNLSLACQLLGKPLPSEDSMRAFERVTKAMDYNEPGNRHERRQMERRLMKKPRILHIT